MGNEQRIDRAVVVNEGEKKRTLYAIVGSTKGEWCALYSPRGGEGRTLLSGENRKEDLLSVESAIRNILPRGAKERDYRISKEGEGNKSPSKEPQKTIT